MRFKQFLLMEEMDAIDHKAILIAHKIHDMLEHSHIEKDETSMSFNVGQLIKDSSLKQLIVKITNSPSEDSSENIIQIITDEDLKRENLNKILSNKRNFNRLVEQLKQYIVHHHDFSEASEEDLTTHEKQKSLTDVSSFNEKYDNLITAFKASIEDVSKQIEELKKERENTGLHSKVTSIENAMDLVIKKELGSSFKEFQKIIYKLPEAGFVAHIDGKQKKILQARLHDFYEGYLQDLVKRIK